MTYPKSEHRIAAYNKGCRCASCTMACRDAQRRRREDKRDERGPLPGDEMCVYCGLWFSPRGIATHIKACRTVFS